MSTAQDQLPADDMPEGLVQVHTSFGAVPVYFDKLPEVEDTARLVILGRISKRTEGVTKDGRETWSVTVTGEARTITEKEANALLQGKLGDGS